MGRLPRPTGKEMSRSILRMIEMEPEEFEQLWRER